jgi:hypothetical protein
MKNKTQLGEKNNSSGAIEPSPSSQKKLIAASSMTHPIFLHFTPYVTFRSLWKPHTRFKQLLPEMNIQLEPATSPPEWNRRNFLFVSYMAMCRFFLFRHFLTRIES